MKRLLLMIFCVLPLFVASHNKGTKSIKGYYVTVFSKKEIIAYEDSLLKYYFSPIYYKQNDFKQTTRFIPIMIGDETVGYSSDVTKVPYKDVGDSLYVVPASTLDTDLMINQYLATKEDALLTFLTLSKVSRKTPYYEIENNNDYLLRIVYIEGVVRYKDINSFRGNWKPYMLDYFEVTPKNNRLKLFFLKKINSYSPYVEIEGCRPWLPYMEKH